MKKIIISSFLLTSTVLFAKTDEYVSYLENKKEIKMCVDPHWLPFEAIENGKHIGIVADIMRNFSKRIKIDITLVETETWNQSLRFVRERKCDILAASAKTPQREDYLNFTKPYLIFPQVIITREKEDFIEDFKDIIHNKIGITKGSAVGELLKEKYPTINLVDTKNMIEGLFDVSAGKLYGFVNTSAAASYAVAKNGMDDLKIASKIGVDYELSVGVRKDDIILLEIFNKLIDKTLKNDINDIKKKWLNIKIEQSVNYALLYKLIGWFSIIILVILYWNRKLKAQIKENDKIQKELDKLSQVIEQSKVSVIITDTDGNIEYVNPFSISQSGYSKEEFLNSKPSILKSGYQDEEFYKDLWETITSGKTWLGEFSNKKKNNDIYWESAVIAPIFNKKNQIQYFTSIKEDITKQVASREELQRMQEEAVKANNTKSEFLANMSHEIRTPMNAVLGMLYLLEKTHITDIQENYIKKANHAANSLLGLINDILDFSKIEAGKLDIRDEEFDFNNMIMDTLSVIGFKSEQKDLELLVHYDTTIPEYIISDKLRVGQILNNLLSNAVKFTSKGEIILSTKLIKEHNFYIEIMFCVQDSGIGISKKEQGLLFQDFTQLDNSATRSFQGTGLGLSISRKLANLLGGDIWIENSKEGLGSIFCFNIKAKKSNRVKENKNKQKSIKNLKCLVVDDNINAIEVLTKMLESFKFEVKSINNGKDAISIIKKEKFDILFLDYKMDDLDGIDTFKIIKDDLKRNNTKTIMVTAYSKDIVSEDINNIGINGYLSKPISPSTLYDKIVDVTNEDYLETKHINKDDSLSYFNGANILLVEDNKLNQEFASIMLKNRGFNVTIASDGIEALSKITNLSKKYELILMDIQMPHMDGYEATKNIRNMDNEYYKNIPIIALSANALIGDKEKSISIGMQDHIPKPIDPKNLFEVLSKYIKSDKKVVDNLDKKDDTILGVFKSVASDIFDIENTLSKLNNSEDVYLKLLRYFSKSYKNIINEFNVFIENRDIDNLKAKVHELKGVSGNIGAIKLYEKMVILDKFVKQNEYPSIILLKELEEELTKALYYIDKIDIKDIIKEKFDKDKVVELLVTIKDNLEIDISLCNELLYEVTPYLQESYKSFSDELTVLIDEFDTDKAKEIIEEFLKGFN